MQKFAIVVINIIILSSIPVFADEKLNDSLTTLGAEKTANANGTIPAWTGGITTPPYTYQKGGFHPDPFSDDKPLFLITAKNWTQHKEKLSDAHQLMFQKYPDYQIPVYPTRRSASYPDFVYKAITQNAATAQLTSDGNAIIAGAIATPFPVPSNGLQAIWNHLLRYRGQTLERKEEAVVVNSIDDFIVSTAQSSILFPLSFPNSSFDSTENTLIYFKQKFFSPARSAGTLLLVHEMLNKTKENRRSWIYNPGQRRVSRAAFLSYDTYAHISNGLRTYDQFDMFNGAPDYYQWTLNGKQELYVPYNAYPLANREIHRSNLLGPHFLNFTYTRYELHRVWKVTATLKKGKHHIYPKRIFYLDEDSWQILVCEEYDNRQNLWRFSEAHTINYYEIPVILPTAELHYDLKSGQYLLEWQVRPVNFSPNLTTEDFTPEALRHEGNR